MKDSEGKAAPSREKLGWEALKSRVAAYFVNVLRAWRESY